MSSVFHKNAFFQNVTKKICSSLDIDVAMCRCLKYIEKNMPADEMYMSIYEPGLSAIRSIAHATHSKGQILSQLIPVSEKAKTQIETTDMTKVRIVNHPELDPVASSIVSFLGKPDRSALIIQLMVEGKRLGVVIVIANGINRYSTEHADFLSLVSDPFAIAMSNALRHQELLKLKDMLADDNQYLHHELRHLSGDEIIGKDSGLKEVVSLVEQVAPLNNPVLLLGETGTGKEVFANAIHNASSRRDGPLIKVNCGAIPETLLDSEFFGHEKGAFTGAVAMKRGRFERANKGTIFLDEIGELPLNAQVRLLRVLQNKKIERVGGIEEIHVDIRVIVATHRKLEAMVASNEFREDLWFRLNIFPINIPPLRERKKDIPSLVQYIIEKKTREIRGVRPPSIAPGAINKLMDYHWPGNVRELENVVERSLVLCKDSDLTFDFFIPSRYDLKDIPDKPQNKVEPLDEVIIRHIRHALKVTNRKIHGCDGAAKLLGINPSTLRNRMNKLGIVNKKIKLF